MTGTRPVPIAAADTEAIPTQPAPTRLDRALKVLLDVVTWALVVAIAVVIAGSVALTIWSLIFYVALTFTGVIPWPITVVVGGVLAATVVLHLATRDRGDR